MLKSAAAFALLQMIAATAIGTRDVRPPLIHLSVDDGVDVYGFVWYNPATAEAAVPSGDAAYWASTLGLGKSGNPAISWEVTTRQVGKPDLLETCTVKLIDPTKLQDEDRTSVIQATAPTDGHVPITTSGPLVMACVARTA